MSADRYIAWTRQKTTISLAIISVTVQLWTQVFWVISVYFNIRNTLPKSGAFLLGQPVYIYIYIYDISSLRVNDLTLIMLTWRKW